MIGKEGFYSRFDNGGNFHHKQVNDIKMVTIQNSIKKNYK